MKAIVLWLAGASLFFVFMASQAPQQAEFTKAVEDRGYTNVELGEYSFIGCNKGQLYSSTFTAEINGRQVNGVVCTDIHRNFSINTR